MPICNKRSPFLARSYVSTGKSVCKGWDWFVSITNLWLNELKLKPGYREFSAALPLFDRALSCPPTDEPLLSHFGESCQN